MRLHRYTINELERQPQPGVLYYKRRFWTLYKAEERESASWHLETRIIKPTCKFGFTFHVGNAGSETPFDGHLVLFGSAVYWGISSGRKFAQWLTSSPENKYDGRDISIRVDGTTVWLNFWHPRDRWSRDEFAKWRHFSFNLDPRQRLWGPKRWSYEDLDVAELQIEMPDEGAYPVKVTLQRATLARTKRLGKALDQHLSFDVDAPKGIPSHYDKSGGWKGERTYGFSVRANSQRKDWPVDAKAAITAWVYDRRARSGFRKAQVDA